MNVPKALNDPEESGTRHKKQPRERGDRPERDVRLLANGWPAVSHRPGNYSLRGAPPDRPGGALIREFLSVRVATRPIKVRQFSASGGRTFPFQVGKRHLGHILVNPCRHCFLLL